MIGETGTPSSGTKKQEPTALLAVDVGLKSGLAEYSLQGRLLRYRSCSFGNRRHLRRGVFAVMGDLRALELLVLEGGGALADVWRREAGRRGVEVRMVSAENWREVLLYQRHRRGSRVAKRRAVELARRVIHDAAIRKPVSSLRHDAAEAILTGLWAVLDIGWRRSLPPQLERN